MNMKKTTFQFPHIKLRCNQGGLHTRTDHWPHWKIMLDIQGLIFIITKKIQKREL